MTQATPKSSSHTSSEILVEYLDISPIGDHLHSHQLCAW